MSRIGLVDHNRASSLIVAVTLTSGASACVRMPAVHGKRRCRLHGGLSTGPRTPEGLARSRRARWKHGADSVETRQYLERTRAEIRVFLARGAAHRERVMAAAAVLLKKLQRERRNARRRARRALP
jgi:hypothetical protein